MNFLIETSEKYFISFNICLKSLYKYWKTSNLSLSFFVSSNFLININTFSSVCVLYSSIDFSLLLIFNSFKFFSFKVFFNLLLISFVFIFLLSDISDVILYGDWYEFLLITGLFFIFCFWLFLFFKLCSNLALRNKFKFVKTNSVLSSLWLLLLSSSLLLLILTFISFFDLGFFISNLLSVLLANFEIFSFLKLFWGNFISCDFCFILLVYKFFVFLFLTGVIFKLLLWVILSLLLLLIKLLVLFLLLFFLILLLKEQEPILLLKAFLTVLLFLLLIILIDFEPLSLTLISIKSRINFSSSFICFWTFLSNSLKKLFASFSNLFLYAIKTFLIVALTSEFGSLNKVFIVSNIIPIVFWIKFILYEQMTIYKHWATNTLTLFAFNAFCSHIFVIIFIEWT